MNMFKKKRIWHSYDKQSRKPVIKASIWDGEQVISMEQRRQLNYITDDRTLYRTLFLIIGHKVSDKWSLPITYRTLCIR